MTDPYEVYALRYATIHARRASDLFFRYPPGGLEDRVLDMACYFWLVRNRSRVVLVDCGWNRIRGLGGTAGRFRHVQIDERDPVELLARFDVDPASVDHIVVSHMHIDHIGNLDLFPCATVSVARAELDCWTGPYGERPAIAHSTSPEDVEVLQRMARDGRVALIDEPEPVFPGITVTPVGGHSPGQMIVDIEAPTGTVILASDAVHYHEEIDNDRPFYIYTDLLAMLRAYDLLRTRAARPDTWLVTGHDPAEMDRFAPVDVDCLDLTRPRV